MVEAATPASRRGDSGEKGIELKPLNVERTENRLAYRHVTVTIDPERRTAELMVRGPEENLPSRWRHCTRRAVTFGHWPWRAS